MNLTAQCECQASCVRINKCIHVYFLTQVDEEHYFNQTGFLFGGDSFCTEDKACPC